MEKGIQLGGGIWKNNQKSSPLRIVDLGTQIILHLRSHVKKLLTHWAKTRLSGQKWVPRRYVHPRSVHVTLRPKRSSPMDRHLAPPISGSWSPGAARAVDGASLLHGPLRVDRNAETKKKWTGGRTVGGRNVKAPKNVHNFKILCVQIPLALNLSNFYLKIYVWKLVLQIFFAPNIHKNWN